MRGRRHSERHVGVDERGFEVFLALLERGGGGEMARSGVAEDLLDGFEVDGGEGADVEAEFFERGWV